MWAIRITGVELIPTVAAANPRTVVVTDAAAPVLVP